MMRFDERDTIFARMAYLPGTWQYDDYYLKHPERKIVDATLRRLPDLCSEKTRFYHPEKCAAVNANFSLLQTLHPLCESYVSSNRGTSPGVDYSESVKSIMLSFGAESVRIARMRDEFHYSFRGRHLQHYGEPVERFMPYGVVFSVRMDKEMIDSAPDVDEMLESSTAYVKAAMAGLLISSYISNLGYSARTHMDGNYLAVLPVVAESAGLGVFGRNGLLITRDSGPAVKLGLVTTDLPLAPDPSLEVDLERFCEECRKCSDRCPSSAIPKGSKQIILGTRRWQISSERCYSFWRNVGTDCGLCIKNCPFPYEISLSDFISNFR